MSTKRRAVVWRQEKGHSSLLNSSPLCSVVVESDSEANLAAFSSHSNTPYRKPLRS